MFISWGDHGITENSVLLVLAKLPEAPRGSRGISFGYMMLAGYLFGGWHMARSARVALKRLGEGSDNTFYEQKIATAVFYAVQILPRCAGHAGAVDSAAGSLQSYPVDWI